MTEHEEWRQIPPYPNYDASSSGRVRRSAGGQGARAGRVLKPKRHEYGYDLYHICHEGKIVTATGHRLVALAFLGDPPAPDAHAAHDDGNPANNRAANIIWKTATENADDKWRHGTQPFGESHHGAKLNDAAVREMRELRQSGLTFKQLGERFGVSASNAYEACRGRQWSHV